MENEWGEGTARGAALVTGGASGVGLAVTQELLADGWSVTALDVDRTALDALAGQGSERLFTVCADVRNEADVARAVQASLDRFGRISGLCACAGIKRRGSLGQTSLTVWNEVLDINLTGTYLAIRHVMPSMVRAGYGRIVTIASASAYAESHAAAYAASKGGILALTRSLALEAAPDHVAVNCVVPGVTKTPMVVFDDAELRARGRGNVTGRVNNPEDVARAIRFLLSPDAATISGAIVEVGHVQGQFAGAGAIRTATTPRQTDDDDIDD